MLTFYGIISVLKNVLWCTQNSANSHHDEVVPFARFIFTHFKWSQLFLLFMMMMHSFKKCTAFKISRKWKDLREKNVCFCVISPFLSFLGNGIMSWVNFRGEILWCEKVAKLSRHAKNCVDVSSPSFWSLLLLTHTKSVILFSNTSREKFTFYSFKKGWAFTGFLL